MSPMEIRILLRRLELERLAGEGVGLDADRPAWGDMSAGKLALHAADVAELRRRADQRGARWS
jgi:hypothetical protein